MHMRIYLHIGTPCYLEYIVQFKRYYIKTFFGQNLTFQRAGVTLKIMPGSPKSNQLFTLSLQYIYASLVKIEPSEDNLW